MMTVRRQQERMAQELRGIEPKVSLCGRVIVRRVDEVPGKHEHPMQTTLKPNKQGKRHETTISQTQDVRQANI